MWRLGDLPSSWIYVTFIELIPQRGVRQIGTLTVKYSTLIRSLSNHEIDSPGGNIQQTVNDIHVLYGNKLGRSLSANPVNNANRMNISNRH